MNTVYMCGCECSGDLVSKCCPIHGLPERMVDLDGVGPIPESRLRPLPSMDEGELAGALSVSNRMDDKFPRELTREEELKLIAIGHYAQSMKEISETDAPSWMTTYEACAWAVGFNACMTLVKNVGIEE